MTTSPSLKGLQAFEAAARSGSFAAAAKELSVSPAAVSQIMRTLEHQLGRRLFHRISRGIVLTEVGQEVLPRLSAAIEELKGVSRQLSGAGHRTRLSISVPPSVATGWLSTRIADFVAVHGPLDISLRGDSDPVAFDKDLIDIRMSYGSFHYREHGADEIVTDVIFPVCSPAFLARHGPFDTADSLLDEPLIHTDWGPAAATFPAWRDWFETASVSPGRHVQHGLLANSSIVAVEMAAGGLGIALCQGLLAVRPIEEGSLVRPSDRTLALSQPYFLTIPQSSANRPIVLTFKDWLVPQCVSSVRSFSPALENEPNGPGD